MPSGMIDQNDIISHNQIDSFEAIKREIVEETCVSNRNIYDVYCLGLVWNDPHKQTCIHFLGEQI